MTVREDELEVDVLRQRLNAVQHLTGVGFWEWRIPENETLWTDSMYGIFGLEPGEIGPSYEGWLGLVHPDDRDHVHGLVQKAFETCSSYVFDHRIIRPTGEERVLHCRGQVYADEDGHPLRIAGVSEDVTRKRTGEDDLRRFIADAAHELRTPVAAIEAAAELIERARTQAHTDSGMRVLRRQVDRLNNLTTSLLDLEAMRPDGRLGLVVGPVALGQVLLRAAEVVEFAQGQTVEVDVGPSSLAVRALEQHVERVAVILLDNARKYGGPTVRVSARRLDDTHAVVEVSDDGHGVPVAIHESLFMPFSRGRHADGSGAGLGLAICQRLVEGFGGMVQHEPREGGGATFRFTLELAP